MIPLSKGVFSSIFIVMYNTLYTTPPILVTAFMDQPNLTVVAEKALTSLSLSRVPLVAPDNKSNHRRTISSDSAPKSGTNSPVKTFSHPVTPYFLPRLTPLILCLHLGKGIGVSATLVWFILGELSYKVVSY